MSPKRLRTSTIRKTYGRVSKATRRDFATSDDSRLSLLEYDRKKGGMVDVREDET